MNLLSPRAGAIASAALFVSLASGIGLSGAIAQDQIVPDQISQDQAALPGVEAPAAPQEDVASEIRFHSQPVVQDISAAGAPVPRREAGSLYQLVASIPADDVLSPELTCLAKAVYFEARGEPLDGQLAVARVVINRTASPRFPDDYCSVVTQRGQFSFVRGGEMPSPNTGSAAWQRARAIARIAHQDLWDSPAGDSLFFHASHVRPQWAARRASVARIDSHIFYR